MASVLLITSDLTVQKAVESALHGKEFETAVVDNGISAIDVALKHPPDLILADFNPEEMNSLTFFQEIRQKERLTVIPVILMMRPEESCDPVQWESAGVQSFLTKPVDALELTNEVRKRATSPKATPDLENEPFSRQDNSQGDSNKGLSTAPMEEENRMQTSPHTHLAPQQKDPADGGRKPLSDDRGEIEKETDDNTMRSNIQAVIEKVVREACAPAMESTLTRETIASIIEKVAREIVPHIAEIEIVKEIKRLKPEEE